MRKVIVGVLLLSLVLFQHLAIGRLPEKHEEERYTDLSRMPASKALPQYMGLLFLGAFRAVAVSGMWVHYVDLRDELRFPEALGVFDLISYLQPRNEVVWGYLCWEIAYNVATVEIDDPQERWRFIRWGMLKNLEGIKNIPWSPYLKHQLAFMLEQKATWNLGVFQQDYLDAFDRDEELQRILTTPPNIPPKGNSHISPFVLSAERYQEARKTMEEYIRHTGEPYYAAPDGCIVTTLDCDISIRNDYALQAILCWHQKKFKEADEWFAKAIEYGERLLEVHKGYIPSELQHLTVEFYKEWKPLLPRLETFERQTEDEKIKTVRAMERLLDKYPTYDDHYIFTWVSEQKRALGGDDYEYNGNYEYVKRPQTRLLIGYPLKANIGPTDEDIDIFWFGLDKPLLKRVHFSLEKGAGKNIPLHLSIHDSQYHVLAETTLSATDSRGEVSFSPTAEDLYFVRLEVAGQKTAQRLILPYTLSSRLEQ